MYKIASHPILDIPEEDLHEFIYEVLNEFYTVHITGFWSVILT